MSAHVLLNFLNECSARMVHDLKETIYIVT